MRLHISAAAALLVGLASVAHGSIDSARITGGEVRGVVDNDVASFKGLPFAAPPIGDLRWQTPRAVKPWKGVRVADTFAPACMQSWAEHEPNRPSEDCLYLNVWTSARSARERRPVMVWIHGGGLVGGMSWEKVSDGATLAREGMVVVTIAYRLGAFGFVAHPELTREHGRSAGNYGLHDMIAALQWVQDNIAQFGGDPSRVMIIGGSAGALSVNFLTTSPRASGLFSRAVALGGTSVTPAASDNPQHPFFDPTLSSAEAKGVELFKSLGAASLRDARKISSATLLKATEGWPPKYPVIRDGDLVVEPTRVQLMQGKFNDVPILIGYTSDEVGEPPPQVTRASAEADLKNAPCKQTHAELTASYPPLVDDEQTRALVRQVNRDGGIGLSVWTWARLHTAHSRHRAFVYFFDVHGPDRPHGAPHATEYPFVFGNFPGPASESDHATSRLVRAYLLNFAGSGDPNGAALPCWVPYDTETERTMVFDAEPGSRAWPNLRAIKAFDRYFACFTQLPLEQMTPPR